MSDDYVAEEDDSFELVTSPSPPRLRSFRLCQNVEVESSVESEDGSQSPTPGTRSMLPSSPSSSSSTELKLDPEAADSIDPPRGQRGVWDEYVQATPKTRSIGTQVGASTRSPPRGNSWAAATLEEVHILRQENRMLQQNLEPGVLGEQFPSAVQLTEAAMGWRHHYRTEPILRLEGETLDRPGMRPAKTAPPEAPVKDLPPRFQCLLSCST